MRKFYLLFFALLSFSALQSQEICNNGIDDDGDGLIDLNDATDCVCTGSAVSSLIPNPSFETMNCCPSTYSQMNCAGSWIQASSATSDYMNTCGIVFGAATAAGLVPFPNGNGIVGTIFSPGWQEYVGACLTSPMIAGTPYTINMSIASTPIDGQGGVCNGGVIDYGPIDIVIYGTTNCANLPFAGTGCPPAATWQVLGMYNYTPASSWGTITINFTPPVNIAAIIIGSPCTLPASYSPPSGCYPYFYYDNLLLNASNNSNTVTQTGTQCANNIVLTSSTTAGATYQWYLNGVALVGETNSTLNVSAGGYPVGNYTCMVTVGSGCSVASTTVVSSSTVTATFSNTNVCVGTATTFTDNSTTGSGTITGWAWNFGDPASGGNNTSALQNPTHIFTAAGTYNVTLTSTASNGCTNTIIIPVTVNPLPTPSFTYTQVCASVTVNFTSTSTVPAPGTITGNSWNFGDPASGGNNTSALSNPSHIFTAPGTYNVTLTSTTNNGCPLNTTQVITVGVPPTAAFTATTVCPNTPMQFTNNSIAAGSYHWDFGDGAVTNDTSNISNPSWSYPNPGTYTVTLIANPGPCQNSATVSVTVSPLPAPAFTASSVCVGSPTVFTDQSTIASGTITGYHWDFGNLAATNDTSNIQNPTYTYPAVGSYNATLTTTSSAGCTSTTTVTVTVNPLPTPSFVYNQVCAGSLVNFSSTSTVPAPSTITGSAWDFGDPASGGNNTSALLNPSHTFTAAGVYTVTLVVTTNNNCSQTITQTITVVPPPTSAFIANQVCTNSPMQFTNQSINATQYHWDFGVAALTNDTSNLSNPTYTYTTAGTYVVTLIANPGSCSDTTTLSVTVNPGPAVTFVAPAVCLGSPSSFTDQSTIAAGTITSWHWDFGVAALTNDTSNIQNPNYTFTTSGIFNVTLTCTSNNGCTSTITIPVTVNALPTANFSSTIACQGSPTTLTDLSAAGSGAIINWSWNFGDGSPVSLTQNPSHTYANDSTYNVSLIVTNTAGCIDTVNLPVVTSSNPVVAFSADTFSGCPLLCVDFADLTTNASGPVTGWTWDFGDNSSTSNLQNPSHCYSLAGTYSVTLTSVANGGCTSTLMIPNMITVDPTPHASFSASPNPTTILSPTVNFTDLSSGNPVTWHWDFGDLSTTADTDNVQNTQYTYEAETGGTYDVNLVVTNQFGCVDDTTIEIIVEPDFAFFIPNSFTPNEDGINDGFYGKGYGITTYELWVFDRWGNMIFTTKDINEAWDGSVQGKGGDMAQIDVYVWKVVLTDVFNKKHKYIGHVSLIK